MSLEILHRQFPSRPNPFFYQCLSYVFTLTLLFRPIFSFLYFTTYRYETWPFFHLIAHSTAPGFEYLVFLKPLQLLTTIALPILNSLCHFLVSTYISVFCCCPACNLVSLVFHCSIYHFIFCFKWTTDCYFFDATIAIFIVSSLFISGKITLFT